MSELNPEFFKVVGVVSSHRMLPMHTKGGRGKELCDMLRKELDIPEGVQSFSVRFAMGEAVTVECKYLPQEFHE